MEDTSVHTSKCMEATKVKDKAIQGNATKGITFNARHLMLTDCTCTKITSDTSNLSAKILKMQIYKMTS